MLAIVTIGIAQAVKLGYVDTDRLLFESNEALEIQRLFNLDKQNWSSQIKAMEEEIRRMEQDYEIDKLTKNEAAKRDALDKIEARTVDAGRLLQEYFGEGGKAEQRYRELIDPLTLKIQEVIVKVAQDEKYTMIFDSSYPTILYAIPSIDITDIVLLEINKDTIAPGTEADTELKPDETKPEPEFKDPMREDVTNPNETKPPIKP
jgi:Skp family chaperone for outer membrane proteins